MDKSHNPQTTTGTVPNVLPGAWGWVGDRALLLSNLLPVICTGNCATALLIFLPLLVVFHIVSFRLQANAHFLGNKHH